MAVPFEGHVAQGCRRSGLSRSGLARGARPGHAVADAAHVEDPGRVRRVVAELLAELFHEGAHDLGVAVAPPGPDPVQQRLGGRDPSGVEREGAEQLVLGGGELDLAPGHGDQPPVVVDGQLAQHERLGIGAPAQGRPDPRRQLGRREGLDDVVRRPRLHRAERAIAGRLLGIAAGNLPWPDIDPDKALPWVEGKTGLALAPGQADAVRAALSSKVSVITGGPGVGKTTIVNSILRILAAKGVEILLCAPTGRAAKRMSEATGLEAKTIHRLLEVDPRNGGFRRDAHNPLHCGLLVIDETSMVDVMLMRALLAAVRHANRARGVVRANRLEPPGEVP